MDYVSESYRIAFPAPATADRWGIVAQGGNLSPGVLLSAYEQGIFPWYDEPPILWFSPDPRFVLHMQEIHIPRRLARSIRKSTWRVTCDRAFEEVITRCRDIHRPRQRGTWITPEMVEGYVRLHHLGYTHSIEVWDGERLIGGLYGVAVGGIFAGESMFSDERDASKHAMVALIGLIDGWGGDLIDCQSYTDNLAAFGAREIAREVYLAELESRRDLTLIPDDWSELDGVEARDRGLVLADRLRRQRDAI